MSAHDSMIANLWHAGRTSGATIGGGEFTRAECRSAAAALESVPDLLEALEALLDDQRDASLPVLVQARAAIAKARGEA